MNSIEISWLAGLLEGEGCFHINHSHTYPKIVIEMQMTDEDVVRKACEVAGVGNVILVDRLTDGWKNCWRWSVTVQQDAAALMMTIYPLMGSRRKKKIESCLRVWRSFPYRQYRPCPQGHSYTFKQKNSEGKLYCTECNRIRSREYGRRKRLDAELGY